jgi:hypothetical protein
MSSNSFASVALNHGRAKKGSFDTPADALSLGADERLPA